MKRFATPLDTAKIRSMIGGELLGDHSLSLSSVSEARDADSSSVIFVDQEKYLEAANASGAGLIICHADFTSRLSSHQLLIVPKPYLSLMTLVTIWLQLDAQSAETTIEPGAAISPAATLGKNLQIAATAYIAEGAVVGDGCKIGAGCVISKNARLGSGCLLYANSTVYEDCVLGDRVILHSGAVIGADGFGFLLEGGVQIKIPQIGNVVLGNDVEIGANSCVDRATLGSTIIGEGTKIDNLVQIGHNCVIGKHSILCAQVGLAGSTIVGDYVYLAGQVGAAGHLKIGDKAMVGAQSGIVNDVPEGSKYFGSPAREAGAMKRIMAAEKYLPEIYRSYQRSVKKENGS